MVYVGISAFTVKSLNVDFKATLSGPKNVYSYKAAGVVRAVGGIGARAAMC